MLHPPGLSRSKASHSRAQSARLAWATTDERSPERFCLEPLIHRSCVERSLAVYEMATPCVCAHAWVQREAGGEGDGCQQRSVM